MRGDREIERGRGREVARKKIRLYGEYNAAPCAFKAHMCNGPGVHAEGSKKNIRQAMVPKKSQK